MTTFCFKITTELNRDEHLCHLRHDPITVDAECEADAWAVIHDLFSPEQCPNIVAISLIHTLV